MDPARASCVRVRFRRWAFATAALVAVIIELIAAPAAAQGVFAPGVEGQIWHQLPAVGQSICTQDPVSGFCNDTPTFDLGKYYYPVAITSDVLAPHSTSCVADNGTIINYVADQSNHRIQAFDYCGNPVPFTHAPGGLPTIGGGPVPAGPMLQGAGSVGLSFPQGVAVDSAHNIIVADLGNSRIVIFHQDGSYLAMPTASTDIPVPSGSLPTGVAAFPGTVMGVNGYLAVLLSRPPFSALLIYDAQGRVVARNPQPESCGLPAAAGSLCGPTDLAIATSNGHTIIYAADYQNNPLTA